MYHQWHQNKPIYFITFIQSNVIGLREQQEVLHYRITPKTETTFAPNEIFYCEDPKIKSRNNYQGIKQLKKISWI